MPLKASTPERSWQLVNRQLTGWSIFLIYLVVFTGFLTLVGWQFNISGLKRPLPGLVAMNPLTAISFIMSGISFLLLSSKNKSKSKFFAGYALASLLIVISLMKLVNTLVPSAPGIDHILFYQKLRSEAEGNLINGMAVNTALGFILTGCALLLLNYETKQKRNLSHYIALLIFIFGFFSILGYLYGAPEFYDLLRYLPMAVHTAIGFLLLSLAILLIHPHTGLTKEFFSPMTGGFIARLLIPLAILIPVIFGAMRLYSHRMNIFTGEFGTTLLVLGIVMVFCTIITYNVVLINKKDRLRRKTEEKFRGLLESAPDALVIAGIKGEIQLTNAQAEKMFGYSRDELIGQHVEMLIPERYHRVHNSHRTNYFMNPKTRAMGEGMELFGRKKDGTEFYVEISLSPLDTEDGMLVYAAIRDISERKKIEEKLRQSEEIFRSLVTSVRDYAIFMLDVNGCIVTWNQGAEEIKGYSGNEVRGRHMCLFYTQEDRDKNLPGFLLDMAKAHGRIEDEGWRLKKDGTVFWADVIITALYDSEGELAGFAKVTKDITERKKAGDLLSGFNEELSKQVKEKTEKIEETTTQLRHLSAHLQTAREEEKKSVAREIHDQLGQMLAALNMDLVWLRKNTGMINEQVTERFERALDLLKETSQTMRRISRDLHPAVLEDLGLVAALELQSAEFEKRSSIKTFFVSDMAELSESAIPADIKIGLYRIFQESLTNIAKHANAKTVNTFLKIKEASLVFSVSDDGKGFDMEEVAGKKTLGLISIRERTLMMQGDYQIYSIPGEGTTVQLTVPLNLN